MQYSKGSIGRVFVARIDHGEDLLTGLKELLAREKIETAVMFFIGALKDGSLVTGPRETVIPPDPHWEYFTEAREMVGMATVWPENGKPVIHLHSALGRGENTLTGCIRTEAAAYLVVEIVIFEILGTEAVRRLDPATGLKLLSFGEK